MRTSNSFQCGGSRPRRGKAPPTAPHGAAAPSPKTVNRRGGAEWLSKVPTAMNLSSTGTLSEDQERRCAPVSVGASPYTRKTQ